jgi:N-acetylneuraminic acid mutarotase
MRPRELTRRWSSLLLATLAAGTLQVAPPAQAAGPQLVVDNGRGNQAAVGRVVSADPAHAVLAVRNLRSFWTNAVVPPAHGRVKLAPANPLLGGVRAGGVWAAIGVIPPGGEALWQGSFDTGAPASQLLQTSPALATGSSLAGVLNLLTILAEMFAEAPTARSAQAVLDAAATVSKAPDVAAIVQELSDPAPLPMAQHLFNVLSDDQQLGVVAAALAQLDVVVTREALRKLLVWQRLIDLVGMIVDMANAIVFGRSAAQIVFSVTTTGMSAPGTGTSAWQPLPPMPTLRFLSSVATAGDGRIYAIGGGASLADPVQVVEAYDPRTNSWTSVAPLPRGPATYLAAAAGGRDGRVYVFGGGRGDGQSTVEIYDPASNAWTGAAPMPTPRGNLAAAAGADGRIYVLGGGAWVTQGVFSTPLATVEVYDPATNAWSAAPPMPTARGGLAAVLGPDQRIYAIGGDDSLAAGLLATVEVYDPRTRTWETAPPMQTPRSNFGAAVAADGRIYAIGGDPSGTSVEAYSPVTNAWQAAPATAGTRRWTAAATGPDGAVYTIGGVASAVAPDTGEVYGLGPLPAPTYPSPAAAAEAGTLAYLRLQDMSACFRVDTSPLDAGRTGQDAVYFARSVHCQVDASGGPGFALVVYVVHGPEGWHYLDARGTQSPGFVPTVGDSLTLRLGGCANVRAAPSTSAQVATCLASGSTVTIDGGPNYGDGHLWWHLAGRGWMAHEVVTCTGSGGGPLGLLASQC